MGAPAARVGGRGGVCRREARQGGRGQAWGPGHLARGRGGVVFASGRGWEGTQLGAVRNRAASSLRALADPQDYAEEEESCVAECAGDGSGSEEEAEECVEACLGGFSAPNSSRDAGLGAAPQGVGAGHGSENGAAAPPSRPIRSADQHNARAVSFAVVGNVVVACGKIVAFVQTGSSSMLAEALHSLADTANQALLAVGIARSGRAADRHHPYGHHKERFVWSLISACGIFCVGAGVSVSEGVRGFLHPPAGGVHNIGVALNVLIFSFLVEGATLLFALRAVKLSAENEGMSLMRYVRSGSDPTGVAVLLEDGAAVLGVVVAWAAVQLTRLTGNPAFDAAGCLLVGFILGACAVFLISKSTGFLIGQALPAGDTRKLLASLRADPVVERIVDSKSEVLGPGVVRFKAEIDFSGREVVRQYLRGAKGANALDAIKKAAMDSTPGAAALVKEMEDFGQDLIDELGAQVDRVEAILEEKNPSLSYVDLETH